jgi:succinyl-CoA synthetase beta subunit
VGGIRFVENTIDAITVAQVLFNLPIDDECPKVLLAEAKYEAEQEFYLAVTLNPRLRRPVLLGSSQGGIKVRSAIDQMQQVVIDGEFSAFQARQLAVAMGLQGDLINQVSDIVQKMYDLLSQKDLDLVEINPLGVRGTEVMALDGKVSVNDQALARHPDLLACCSAVAGAPRPTLQKMSVSDGTIGILSNGSGLLMATLDQVAQVGGKTACYVNIGGDQDNYLTAEQWGDRLLTGLWQMVQPPLVSDILVSLMTGWLTNEQILQVLQTFDQQLGTKPRLAAVDSSRTVPLSVSPLPPDRLSLFIYCGGMEIPRWSRLRCKHLAVKIYDRLENAIADAVKPTVLD